MPLAPANPSLNLAATPKRRMLSTSGIVRLGVMSAVALATMVASGCVTRTVYVTENAPPTGYNDQARTQPRPQAPPNYNDAYSNAPAVANVSGVGEFYSSLAAYGTWTRHGRYGQVFVPAVRVTGPNFRPYSRGNWEYTEWGWTFVSHQPFGWATAHYGRWFYDNRLGWAWVPGTQWSPAWVTWRTGGGYIGWAPMPPGATYNANYSVYSTGWVFVGYNNFGADVIYPVMIRGSRYDDCYRRTRPYRTTVRVRGRYVYRGPDPSDVRNGGGRVSRRPLRDIDRDRPTSTPPRGVTVRRARESDGGDHNGYAGRDRTGRNGGATTGRDRGDRTPNRGSTIIDDRRDELGRGNRVTEGRDRGRDEGVRSGSTVMDNDRGLEARDRRTGGSRDGGGISSGRDNLGNPVLPNRGSRAGTDEENTNRDLGARDRPNRGTAVIDNDRGVRPGTSRPSNGGSVRPDIDPYAGGQRAPDLSAEIPDDRPQRPYTDSPNGPDARTTRYRRTAPSNPGILPKPAPMTKPSVRNGPSTPSKASRSSRTRSSPSKATRSRSSTSKSSSSNSKASESKSKSKSKSSSKSSDKKRVPLSAALSVTLAKQIEED